MHKFPFNKKVALSAALATTALAGYHRNAYAGCDVTTGTYFSCTGSETSTITLATNAANVSTAAGFSVSTEDEDAIVMSGEGALVFTDENSSSITAIGDIDPDAISITSDNASNTSIAVTVNSNITANGKGINIGSNGVGTTAVNVNGNANVNTRQDGINIGTNASGTGISLEVGASASVSVNGGGTGGSNAGIQISSGGNESTSMIINGSVSSIGGSGIDFRGDDVNTTFSLVTGANSVIDGMGRGINLNLKAAGATSVEIDGSVIGRLNSGVYLYNYGSGINSSIAVEVGGTISGAQYGLYLSTNDDSGLIDITTNSGSKITSGSYNDAIRVNKRGGGGTTTIKISGELESLANAIDIDVSEDADDLVVNVYQGAVINAGYYGINVENDGLGSSSITMSGTILADLRGIYLDNNGNNTAVNITVDGSITATLNEGIDIDADGSTDNNITINGGSVSGFKGITAHNDDTNLNITLNGTSSTASVTGTGGTAILFGSEDDSLTISGSVNLDGDIKAGGGTDTLNLHGTNLTITSGSDLTGFEVIDVTGNNSFNGDLNLGTSNLATTYGGSFEVAGDLTAGNLVISGNSTFSANNTNATTVSLDDGSTLNVNVRSAGVDKITTSGAITIGTDVTINVSSVDSTSGSGVILEGSALTDSFANIVSSDKRGASVVYGNGTTSISLIHFNNSALESQTQSTLNNSLLFSDTLTEQVAEGALINNGRNFWIKTLYRGSDTASNSNSLSSDSKSYGVALGAEMNVKNNPNYKLGFSVAGISNKTDVGVNAGSRSSESAFASIYGSYNRDLTKNVKFFSALSLGLGYHDNDDRRSVVNSGVTSSTKSNSNDTELNATFQAGAKINLSKGFYVTPKASVSYIETNTGSINESAGGVSAVSIDKNILKNIKTRESVRIGHNDSIKVAGIAFSPYAELGLSQEKSMGDRNVTGRFSTGDKFQTTLAGNNRNFVTSAIGANVNISETISGFIAFENASSSREDRNDAKAGVRVQF
jgi:hypothetical protein